MEHQGLRCCIPQLCGQVWVTPAVPWAALVYARSQPEQIAMAVTRLIVNFCEHSATHNSMKYSRCCWSARLEGWGPFSVTSEWTCLSKWQQPSGWGGDGALSPPVSQRHLPEKCHWFPAPWFSMKSPWIRARAGDASKSAPGWHRHQCEWAGLSVPLAHLPPWGDSGDGTKVAHFVRHLSSVPFLWASCGTLLVLQRETALLGLLVDLVITVSMDDHLFSDKAIQKQIKLTLKIHFQAVKIHDKLRFFFYGFHRPFGRVEEKLR